MRLWLGHLPPLPLCVIIRTRWGEIMNVTVSASELYQLAKDMLNDGMDNVVHKHRAIQPVRAGYLHAASQ